MRSRLAQLCLISSLSVLLAACFPMGKRWEPTDKKKVYGASHQQLAPQPVYNRLRNVELPDVMPPATAEMRGQKYMPVVHLELKTARLEEVASALASLGRYRSYCAGTIANRRVSVNALGTLEELAAEIAAQEKIEVVVDHEAREVRFLARTVSPAFTQNEVSGHESKQAY